MTWQPIETAPKDGSRVLGAIVDEGMNVHPVEVIYWQIGWVSYTLEPHPTVADAFVKTPDPIPGRWSCDLVDPVTATHWMPLPTPPNPQQEERG